MRDTRHVLLREDDQEVIAIGQASHAWLSGQLARAWGNDRFPAPEPHEQVCLAAEQHDVGMAHWDLTPQLNPETGLPRSFMEMSLDDHLRLWSLAPARMLSTSRWAALLVSLHGTTLYGRRDLEHLAPTDADAVRAYLAEQRILQQVLAEELAADERQLDRARRLIFALDALSLALCLRWAPYTVRDAPTGDGGVDLALTADDAGVHRLDPWPFADETVIVRCEGRRLEHRFSDEVAMQVALERAPHVTLEFTLRP